MVECIGIDGEQIQSSGMIDTGPTTIAVTYPSSIPMLVP
jgi:hypothetical protein